MTGNVRITSHGGASDVHHLILDFGAVPFPYLEGQSVGLVPPGSARDGSPHAMRLYSVASARDGERPNTNNMALTVKRITSCDDAGRQACGVASHWLCDGAGGQGGWSAFGSTFTMPDVPMPTC